MRIINQKRIEGVELHVPYNILNHIQRPLDVDIRIVLTWDTDMTNVELEGNNS